MLTKLTINNFKKLTHAEIPLAEAVVFIGPNNSGKTTSLQALTLWDIGLRKWAEKRKDSSARERTGVTINRRDLLSIPIPSARLLWRDLHVRDVKRVAGKDGKPAPKTSNVTFEIAVEGITQGQPWSFGLEFDFANEESLYCRAMHWPESKEERERLIGFALGTRVAYLPPMSGLAAEEFRKEPGEIGVLIGEGRTAEVLRNLCHRVHAAEDQQAWNELTAHIERLFRVKLLPPKYIPERSELRMQYEQHDGLALDLSSAGRGFQQTLLLLAYLYQNRNSALLLDEPDAHLEVIRQRETYNLLTDVAAAMGSQIIAASHSEVVLNEAAERDVVVAFVGAPHRIDSRQRSQAAKSLKSIPFDLYYLAENYGWMLFVEGSTDLAILRSLARKLGHEAAAFLDEPPVHYVKTNIPDLARDVFHGLREAKSDLVGLALLTVYRHRRNPPGLRMLCWSRREIENYLVTPQVLERFARHDQPDDLFGRAESNRRADLMRQCIAELENALRVTNKPSPWSPDIKVTDDFLDPLFKNFYERIGLPQLLFKRNFHVLADLIEPAELATEIRAEIEQKLNAIVAVARNARKPAE